MKRNVSLVQEIMWDTRVDCYLTELILYKAYLVFNPAIQTWGATEAIARRKLVVVIIRLMLWEGMLA